MTKKVKLRAYVEGNLGDDLFLEIICRRYPNIDFFICGSKNLKKLYSKIRNARYISNDTISVRIEMFMHRTLVKIINHFSKKEVNNNYITDAAIEEKWSKKCDYNVLITGSGFMNDETEYESLRKKFIDEKRYYSRNPYLLGCNFGPFAHKEYLMMYQELFKETADLCFRDKYSADLFPMVKQARFESDIVFGYPIEEIEHIPSIFSEKYMLISVANIRKDKDRAVEYYDKYIEFLKRVIIKRNSLQQHTVFVCFSKSQNDDISISDVLDGIRNTQYNHVYSYPEISSDQILRLFYDADSVIASRYHAMILGVLFKKPVCAICYNEKVEHVLDDIDITSPRLHLEELEKLKSEDLDNKFLTISDGMWKKLRESSNRQFQELDKVLK